MTSELKRKVAFAILMGAVTTGIITFTLLALNFGFSDHFLGKWLSSWGVAYVIVIPVILIIGPRLQSTIDQLID